MDTTIPTRSGIICTFEEYAASLSNLLTHCLARANSFGLNVYDAMNLHDIIVQDRPLSLQLTPQAGLLGLVAILFVFIFIVCGPVSFILWKKKLSAVVSPSATPFIGPGARWRDNGIFSWNLWISLWYVVIFVHFMLLVNY